ncbi:hypothetical protein WJ96_05875 [Burkholderia ubonensis]|uniref:Uncharacterized protein n=1 Tax=Burkholderia ubonensis TaxID=101571 RepID=A0AAW3MZ50_9BURK|nr:hypothetical protein [Burkholderia ubonensis]KVP96752.1 hypothetical protein WJ97_12800 [Burkholderia ubonensis]KVP98097.1 hypothetical protein WJ96_05875 [Burkholderia ubonensis]KVZ92794.1 hypothetical protein WL25_17535 [Burkholderia ubonensis]
MDVTSLEVGKTYAFTTKDFDIPTGGVILGERKVRTFVGMVEVGPNGMQKAPFFEVARENGTKHLIAVDAVESVALA